MGNRGCGAFFYAYCLFLVEVRNLGDCDLVHNITFQLGGSGGVGLEVWVDLKRKLHAESRFVVLFNSFSIKSIYHIK